jgi:polysaccharide chain length determinant protein (PEP-CTERM system associated)
MAVAVSLVKFLPKRFTSQTIVLVRQPTVPTDVVKPVVTEDLNHRLASMQEQIMSRSRLEPIIEKFGLYASIRDHAPMDDLIAELRKSIQVSPVEPMQGTRDNNLPGFHVEVTLASPQLAQNVCAEITSMFREQNARSREQQAVRTTSFLTQQLDQAKAKLDEQDSRLAALKSRYLGALPDQEQTNLSLLTGMNSQLEANTQALSRAQQEKAFNQTLLDQELVTWRSSQTGRNPVTLDLQIAALEEQLSALRAKYTNEHPDVIKLKNQIQDLKKQQQASSAGKNQDQADGETRAGAIEPPQIQQLRAKVHQDEVSVSDLVAQQKKNQEQVKLLQGRIQSSPAIEQQFKEITRNYQTALDFYNELLKKQENSAMATNLEHQQESEQFHVLDPPNLPVEPSFPKKKYFLGGGLASGLSLGLGILLLIELSDKSMYTEKDIEVCLKLPVLTIVPVIEKRAGAVRGNRHKRAPMQLLGMKTG